MEMRLNAPLTLAFAGLGEILRDIAAQHGAWRGFPLHIDLGEAGLPDVGYIAVPLTLNVERNEPGLNQLNVTFQAARHNESFPRFKGALGVDVADPTSSMIWIAGSYDVPLATAGKLVNATLMRGIAQRTLENFLDDIATACLARIERREADYVRYRMFGRAT